MKIRKLVTNLIVLLVSAFTFFGCANVEFIRAVDGTNAIIDKFVVELDSEKIKSAGQNVSDIKNQIESDMIYFRVSVDAWKNQFLEFTDLYKALEKGILCEVSVVSNTKLTMTITYSNIQMFGLFYGMSNVTDENDEIFEYKKALTDVGPFIDKILNQEHTNEDYGWFFQKYSVLKDVSIFDNINDIELAGENINDRYRRLTKYAFSLDDVNLSQIFVYPDTSLYSNADNAQVEKGLTMFQWDFSNKPDGFQMEIYKLAPKPYSWYIVGLIISAIVVIALFVVIYKRSKKVEIQVSKEEVEKNE